MSNFSFFFSMFVLFIVFSSCRKDEDYLEGDVKLQFSVDTVSFDTVFSTIGSATKSFLVYNPHDQHVNLSSVTLGNGRLSNCRMNVNGIPGYHVKDISIPPKDSIFIFIEVTVDPTNSNTPMVINDSILFWANGKNQDVKLLAWGQDVHILKDSIIRSRTWSGQKPYLIYGAVQVPEGDTLTIEKGVQVFFHKKSFMEVKGTFVVNGTVEEPVLIQGDRLEEFYEDVPGQWNAIALISNNHHYVNHAIIKNGLVGIQVGYFPDLSINPQLTITNSIIKNMSYSAIYSFGGTIFGANNLFADCGTGVISLFRGGSYDFYHCTFANLGNGFSTGNIPAVVISNYFLHDTFLVTQNLERAFFGNCIIHGSRMNEITINNVMDEDLGVDGVKLDYFFENCLIKADKEVIDYTDENHFKEVFTTNDSIFHTDTDEKYTLNSNSPAIDKGNPIFITNFPVLVKDIKGVSRDGSPDVGAYEYGE